MTKTKVQTDSDEVFGPIVVDKSSPLAKIPTSIITTSGKIRFLSGEGFTRGQISKLLGIRYQHVRNVLITPIKKS